MNKTRRRKQRARRLVSPGHHSINSGLLAINLPPGTVITNAGGYIGHFDPETGEIVIDGRWSEKAPQYTIEVVESGEYTVGDAREDSRA